MYARYYRRSPKELAQLEADPLAAMEHFLSRIEGDERAFSLEKEWHALNFLLTGDSALDLPPGRTAPEQVVRGARESTIEATYGHMRVLDSAEVKAVAAFLRGVSSEELHRRFDPAAFKEAGLYAQPGVSDHASPEIDILIECLVGLRQFFAEAAQVGDAVLIAIE